MAGVKAMAMAVKEQRGHGASIRSLQEYHGKVTVDGDRKAG